MHLTHKSKILKTFFNLISDKCALRTFFWESNSEKRKTLTLCAEIFSRSVLKYLPGTGFKIKQK